LSGTGSGEEPGGVVVHSAVVSPLGEVLVEQGSSPSGMGAGVSPTLMVVRDSVVLTSSSVSSQILLTGACPAEFHCEGVEQDPAGGEVVAEVPFGGERGHIRAQVDLR
jgi:hypothetical protein